PRPLPAPGGADPPPPPTDQPIRAARATAPPRRPSPPPPLVDSRLPPPPPAAPAAPPVSEGGPLPAGSGNAAARTGLRAKMRRVALVASLPGLLALGLVAYGPLHAFRSAVHPARPSPPLLRPVDDGLVS